MLGRVGLSARETSVPGSSLCLLYRVEQRGGVIAYCSTRKRGYYIQRNKEVGSLWAVELGRQVSVCMQFSINIHSWTRGRAAILLRLTARKKALPFFPMGLCSEWLMSTTHIHPGPHTLRLPLLSKKALN